LTLGDALGGGNWAYVTRVRTADGANAVLKVALPTPDFARQLDMLAAADGHGYVRLYAADPARCALLMEPLGPPLAGVGHSVEHQLDVLAATLRQAWQAPRPSEVVAAGGFNKGAALLAFLNEPHAGDEACSPQLIALARTLAERRAAAFSSAGLELCHGDPHADNALAVLSRRAGAESGFVFVDPEAFLCDPAYDLGVAMRGWTEQVLCAQDPVALTRAWSARLAGATGVDAEVVWEWGLVERVTTGLFLIRHGHRTAGGGFLASAERLV
jgi:streptomycin 6-kinase